MRIGQGYDVHRLVEGRRLILGGVEIPYEKGLLGHSDADVLVHAVMDALLGAAALGDIGQHFPDTDPQYEGISSIRLLEMVGQLLDRHHYVIENIDATIVAQRPKLAAYRPAMAANIAAALSLIPVLGIIASIASFIWYIAECILTYRRVRVDNFETVMGFLAVNKKKIRRISSAVVGV